MSTTAPHLKPRGGGNGRRAGRLGALLGGASGFCGGAARAAGGVSVFCTLSSFFSAASAGWTLSAGFGWSGFSLEFLGVSLMSGRLFCGSMGLALHERSATALVYSRIPSRNSSPFKLESVLAAVGSMFAKNGGKLVGGIGIAGIAFTSTGSALSCEAN